MITVAEAIQLLRSNVVPLLPVRLSLREAAGHILATDVVASMNLPSFEQSAMDGYAFCFGDWKVGTNLSIVGEVAAGDGHDLAIAPGEALRIFTGAALPSGLDTVVMQEKTTVNGDRLVVLDDQLRKGSNVRCIGDEIRLGEQALATNTVLTPAAIGFLASLGETDALVVPKPKVTIIVTGKELQKPGQNLKHGQVYESNSLLLQAALDQFRITHQQVVFVGDNFEETKNAIDSALAESDLVLLTGGVSVGNYDFVVPAAAAAGVIPLFHKVRQRPGKPLYAGTREGKLVFGLPGNPASVLSCFYRFVVVVMEQMTGRSNLIEHQTLPLLSEIDKKIPLTQFLKATCTLDGVQPLTAQESFRLSSFSTANCLLVLPEEVRIFRKGEDVEVLRLPYL